MNQYKAFESAFRISWKSYGVDSAIFREVEDDISLYRALRDAAYEYRGFRVVGLMDLGFIFSLILL